LYYKEKYEGGSAEIYGNYAKSIKNRYRFPTKTFGNDESVGGDTIQKHSGITNVKTPALHRGFYHPNILNKHFNQLI